MEQHSRPSITCRVQHRPPSSPWSPPVTWSGPSRFPGLPPTLPPSHSLSPTPAVSWFPFLCHDSGHHFFLSSLGSWLQPLETCSSLLCTPLHPHSSSRSPRVLASQARWKPYTWWNFSLGLPHLPDQHPCGWGQAVFIFFPLYLQPGTESVTKQGFTKLFFLDDGVGVQGGS